MLIDRGRTPVNPELKRSGSAASKAADLHTLGRRIRCSSWRGLVSVETGDNSWFFRGHRAVRSIRVFTIPAGMFFADWATARDGQPVYSFLKNSPLAFRPSPSECFIAGVRKQGGPREGTRR